MTLDLEEIFISQQKQNDQYFFLSRLKEKQMKKMANHVEVIKIRGDWVKSIADQDTDESSHLGDSIYCVIFVLYFSIL